MIWAPRSIFSPEVDHYLARYPALRDGGAQGSALAKLLDQAGGRPLPTFRRRLLTRVVYGLRDEFGASCGQEEVFQDAGLTLDQALKAGIKAMDLIIDFRSNVLPNSILHDYVCSGGAEERRKRRIDPNLDPTDRAVFEKNRDGTYKAQGHKRINFGTLRKYDASRQAAEIREERAMEAKQTAKLPEQSPARKMIEALTSVPPNAMGKLLNANLENARKAALALPPGEKTGSLAAQNYALALVGMVEEGANLTGGYHAVEGSDRVFGNPFQHLAKMVRREVFAGAWDFDLSAAHMRLLAGLKKCGILVKNAGAPN